MALLAEERDECGGCGQPSTVAGNPETQRTWRVHRRTCQACAVLEAEISNDHEAGGRFGVKYAVTRT